MKNFLILLAFFAIGYAATILLQNRNKTYNLPPVENFTFTDMQDTAHNLHDYKGKIVIVNFWATWCPPCIVEFPHLLEIAKNNPETVTLIALSADLEKEKAQTFLTKQKTNSYNNVITGMDTQNLALNTFGIARLPETLIINQDMRQSGKLIGANWEPTELQKKINEMIEKE